MTFNPLRFSRRRALPLAILLATGFAGTATIPAAAQEKAITPEKNPPGDIPDNQLFVTYDAPQGFSFEAPEGWSRKIGADGVTFADKYGRIEARAMPVSAPLTPASVRVNEAGELEKTGRAVKISNIDEVRLPSGLAVRISFTSNSKPNPVTGKQIRLENERYLIGRGNTAAALTFSAPAGADNVDQWTQMSRSFRWK